MPSKEMRENTKKAPRHGGTLTESPLGRSFYFYGGIYLLGIDWLQEEQEGIY
jgi:hypothetical protein